MATSWKDLLNRRDVLVLDTETTGFDASSEVVDIAMIDTTGTRRFNAPVLPKGPIPRAASNIHGLTRAKLESLGARPWSEVHSKAVALLNSASTVLIYNAAYDLRLLGQTAKRYALSFSFDRSKIHCIQLAYAALRREPSPYRAGEWKWHKLAEAHAFECKGGKRRASVQSHRAESDCQMVLEVLRAVSARAGSRTVPRESGDWYAVFRREAFR